MEKIARKMKMFIVEEQEVPVVSTKNYDGAVIVCVKDESRNPEKPYRLLCQITKDGGFCRAFVPVGPPGGSKAEILLPDESAPEELVKEAEEGLNMIKTGAARKESPECP